MTKNQAFIINSTREIKVSIYEYLDFDDRLMDKLFIELMLINQMNLQ